MNRTTARGLATVATGLFLALTASACGATDEGKTVEPLAPIASSAAGQQPVNEQPEASDTEGQLGGKAVELSSGLVVSVSAPEAYRPGQYAIMTAPRTKASKFFVVTVKIENRSAGSLPAGIYWEGTSGAEGDPLDQVFDGEKVGNQPSTQIRPGKRQTFKIAFHQPTGDLSDIVLEGLLEGFTSKVTLIGKL